MRTTVIPVAAAALLAAAVEAGAQPDAVAPAGHRAAVPAVCTGKVCVTEMAPTKKVVFGSKCVDFCYPRGCLATWLKSCCGPGCAAGAECGAVRTKRVLLKKAVPGPDAPKCVLKELPGCVIPGPGVHP